MNTSEQIRQLIANHEGYAMALTRKLAKRLPKHVEFDELLGFANVGLVEAAQKYRFDQGTSFETFSYYRIRGAVFDGLRKMTWLPSSVRNDMVNQSAADEINEPMGAQSASSNDPETLASQFLDGIRRLGAVRILSEISNSSWASDPAGPETTPAFRAERNELLERARHALRQIPKDEQEIIRQHYFEGRSLTECAVQMKVHKATTSRLHARAVKSMRRLLEVEPGNG